MILQSSPEPLWMVVREIAREGQSQESVPRVGSCLRVELLSKTVAGPHW